MRKLLIVQKEKGSRQAGGLSTQGEVWWCHGVAVRLGSSAEKGGGHPEQFEKGASSDRSGRWISFKGGRW